MVVDVLRDHLAVGRPLVGDRYVVAVVDRRPDGAVGGDRQPGAVAHAGRERLCGATARRHAQDGRPGWGGDAILGRDVSGRSDREVHGAIGSHGDALQRVRVRAVQVGTLGVRQARRHRAWVGDRAVDEVERVDLIALRDVQRGAVEGQAVRLVETVDEHRRLRTRAGGLEAHHLAGAGHRHQHASVRGPRGQSRLGHPGPHRHRPAVGHHGPSRLIEGCRRQPLGHRDGDLGQLHQPGGGGPLRRLPARRRHGSGRLGMLLRCAATDHDADERQGNYPMPQQDSHASPTPAARTVRSR